MQCRDRKDIRLKDFDYSRSGAYFVTVCTAGEKCLFWEDHDVFPPADIYDNIPETGVGAVTKKSGFPVWQKNFYEHIIRNQKEYADIWEYIQNNPINWVNDEYYTKEK